MSAKRKLPAKLGQPMVKQPAKIVGKASVDESRTVVSGGGNAIRPNMNGAREIVDISSDSSSEDGENVESENDDEDESAEEDNAHSAPGGADVAMVDPESASDGEGAEGTGEPSFGDLVRANASEPIDVIGALDDPTSRALTFPQGSNLQAPSGASLGTVLTQALKTNDVSLLESCLHTTDVNTIRATIQRLDSPLAGTLLHKLAERLHRRPGRAGSLMVWVQWTIVTHGGYLATQRDLVKKLAELYRVIDTRLKGLQPLLALKGKLDMLEAQIELRRSLQNQRRRLDEDDDDDGVIYVEGQESDEENAAADGDLSDMDSEISEDMPLTNGVAVDSEDEGDSSEEDDLIDDEAEETDAESGDEDEVNHDDLDSQVEDEDSDDVALPPTKMQRIGGLFSRKR